MDSRSVLLLDKNDFIAEIKKELIYILHHYLKEKNEDGLIEYIHHLSSRYLHRLHELLNYPFFIIVLNDSRTNVSLIHLAVIHEFNMLIRQISKLGADINQKIGSVGVTPLMLAAGNEKTSSLVELLELGADITIKSDSNYKIIFFAKDIDIFNMLLNFKQGNDYQQELFSDRYSNDQLIQYACEHNQLDFVKLLLSSKQLTTNMTVKSALHNLRFAAWNNKNNQPGYDRLCQELNSILGKEYVPQFDLDETISEAESIYFLGYYVAKNKEYFQDKTASEDILTYDFRVRRDKTETIKSIILQINAFMLQPKRCFKFFRHLNEELIQYIDQKYGGVPEKLSPDSMQFGVIADVMYKFPKDTHYQGLRKQHALQELLVSILRKHGLANNMYKWVGHVPGRLAKEMLRKGDFVTEGRMGIGLLHGKLAHMLQIILCIYILESDLINSVYIDDDGTEKTVVITDLLDAFFNYKNPNKDNVSLFKSTFDTRITNWISLGDPHRLTSLLICHGSATGWEVLSDHIADSFIKAFLSMLHVHNTQREPGNQLSINDFISQLSQTDIQFFNNPQCVSDAAFKSVTDDVRAVIVEEGDNFMVVKKDYAVNENFEPRRCH